MATQTIICKAPLITVSASAIVCNIIMFLLQQRKKIISGGIRYFLYSLVSIDLAYSLFILTMALRLVLQNSTAEQNQASTITQATIRCLGFSFTHIQLLTQTAIAVERFIAVAYPIFYRGSSSKVNRKMVNVGIWLFSLSFGTAVTYPSILYNHSRVISITCGGMYMSSLILVATMYVLMTFQVIKGNKRVIEGAKEQSNQNNQGKGGRVRRERAKEQERKSMIFSFTIVTTYFILNTPLIIYSSFFDIQQTSGPMIARSCNTANGVFANVAFGLAAFNRFFDPLLYFYLKYHMNKQKAVRIESNKREIEGTSLHNLSMKTDDTTTAPKDKLPLNDEPKESKNSI